MNHAFAEENENLTEFGDAMQFILPLTAWGATFIYDDQPGRFQFYKSALTSLTITTVGKGIVEKTRPNNSSSKTSYPSGHTTGAFLGATFLNTRYGPKWGIPAYTLATITAYSRVQADAHHVDDVIAGASVSFFSNLFWVTPFDSNITVTPMVIGDTTGIAVTVTDGKPKKTRISSDSKPKYRYALGFGPAFMQKNEFTSPTATGTTFDLANFEGTTDPLTTAAPTFDWFVADRHTLSFTLSPFEARDFGTFSAPTFFAGQVFPANTEIRSAYRMTELDIGYHYGFHSTELFDFRVGARLAYTRTVLELETTTGTPVYAKVDDRTWLPMVSAGMDIKLNHKWSILVDIAGISLSTDKQVDGSLLFSYQFNPYWDAAFGYSYYERDIETSELTNHVQYDILTLVTGYSFH
ncbi:MAG: phosphatase PAP2 family protein [Gammaproteobacteria bacterium]